MRLLVEISATSAPKAEIVPWNVLHHLINKVQVSKMNVAENLKETVEVFLLLTKSRWKKTCIQLCFGCVVFTYINLLNVLFVSHNPTTIAVSNNFFISTLTIIL